MSSMFNNVEIEESIIDMSDETLSINLIEKQQIKRTLVAMKVFNSDVDFENWQREEPREIFEVTPSIAVDNNKVVIRIFVTYNGGLIS